MLFSWNVNARQLTITFTCFPCLYSRIPIDPQSNVLQNVSLISMGCKITLSHTEFSYFGCGALSRLPFHPRMPANPHSCLLHNALSIPFYAPPYLATFIRYNIISSLPITFISPTTSVATFLNIISLLKWQGFCKPCNKLKNIVMQTCNF